MRRLLGSIFLVAVIVSGAVPLRADDDALRVTLQARYAAIKAAIASHDAKGIATFLTPDFMSTDISGQTEDGSQMAKEVSLLPIDPLKTSETTLLSVRSQGAIATVDQRYDMKTVKTAPDGTKRNVELTTLSTDTWVLSNGTWLIQRTDTNQLDYYVDGQLVAHKTKTSQTTPAR